MLFFCLYRVFASKGAKLTLFGRRIDALNGVAKECQNLSPDGHEVTKLLNSSRKYANGKNRFLFSYKSL